MYVVYKLRSANHFYIFHKHISRMTTLVNII